MKSFLVFSFPLFNKTFVWYFVITSNATNISVLKDLSGLIYDGEHESNLVILKDFPFVSILRGKDTWCWWTLCAVHYQPGDRSPQTKKNSWLSWSLGTYFALCLSSRRFHNPSRVFIVGHEWLPVSLCLSFCPLEQERCCWTMSTTSFTCFDRNQS